MKPTFPTAPPKANALTPLPRLGLLLALLLYLPQALAVVISVQLKFLPQDPISPSDPYTPAATLTGSLQL
jgi:hypothetical protein